ncbi:hypothetical protein [Streptomyces sp. NPDC088350]|uniref:hypothetical protein n=1 Tax=Streptomyces sp. NPDC088350 TaxID=3365854 RepID=UPI0037F6BED8
MGQRRTPALRGGSRDELEIHPNLWAGVGLVRGGAGGGAVPGGKRALSAREGPGRSTASVLFVET